MISKAKDALSSITNKTSSSTSSSSSSTVSGSHANGLDYVPYDGYIAELHKGERVMTAEENQAYSGGSTVKAIEELTAMVARNMAMQQQLLSNLNFNVNGREFARLVKAVE